MEIDVKDRNVLLVGNSVELMRNSFGRWIDLQDYVVRFGKGATLPDNKVQIGSKMDCWVTGSLRWRYAVTNKNDPHRGWPDFPLDKIPILYNRCRINLSKPIEDDIIIQRITDDQRTFLQRKESAEENGETFITSYRYDEHDILIPSVMTIDYYKLKQIVYNHYNQRNMIHRMYHTHHNLNHYKLHTHQVLHHHPKLHYNQVHNRSLN